MKNVPSLYENESPNTLTSTTANCIYILWGGLLTEHDLPHTTAGWMPMTRIPF